MSPRYIESNGRTLRTGRLLGKGGEGSVYEIDGRPDAVAKVFHQPATGDKARKLTAMVSMVNEQLLTIASWPTATLHTQSRQGLVAGIVMPRISGYQEMHYLHGPKSRLATFPQADWRFLIHAGANTARAFANLHQTGAVMGDVNDRNVLVSQQGTVRLIDCDSFQIVAGGRVFPCPVGVATHTPPELQGISLGQVRRTTNHDAFGLAVLIFQLLFMGRHPFSGRYMGQGDLPIEQAIAEGRFAYGADAATRLMAPPPHTLSLDAITPEVATLFLRAFAASNEQRPTAAEWTQGLSRLSRDTVRCDQVRSHTFLNTLGVCPWCRIESGSGAMLFAAALVTTTGAARASFDLDNIWNQIAAVASPGPLPPPVTMPPGPPASPRVVALNAARGKRRLVILVITAVIALPLFALGSRGEGYVWLAIGVIAAAFGVNWGLDAGWRGSRAAAEDAMLRAGDQWTAQLARWSTLSSDPFDQARVQLAAKVQEYRELPALRQRELQILERNSRALQLNRHLDARRIDQAQIPGVGPARMAMLQSFGIETAAEVDAAAVRQVPGFGPSLTAALLDWRQSVERTFVFNPRTRVDPADVAALDRRLLQTRVHIEQTLLAGPETLRRTTQRVLAAREAQKQQLLAAAEAYRRLQADYNGH
ncbi:MAG: hypothetical protein KC442_23395 [Thermomicrobiales bacterium]|nr:hypothetical protein [Thermomicrobiales bacterium]